MSFWIPAVIAFIIIFILIKIQFLSTEKGIFQFSNILVSFICIGLSVSIFIEGIKDGKNIFIALGGGFGVGVISYIFLSVTVAVGAAIASGFLERKDNKHN